MTGSHLGLEELRRVVVEDARRMAALIRAAGMTVTEDQEADLCASLVEDLPVPVLRLVSG